MQRCMYCGSVTVPRLRHKGMTLICPLMGASFPNFITHEAWGLVANGFAK